MRYTLMRVERAAYTTDGGRLAVRLDMTDGKSIHARTVTNVEYTSLAHDLGLSDGSDPGVAVGRWVAVPADPDAPVRPADGMVLDGRPVRTVTDAALPMAGPADPTGPVLTLSDGTVAVVGRPSAFAARYGLLHPGDDLMTGLVGLPAVMDGRGDVRPAVAGDLLTEGEGR